MGQIISEGWNIKKNLVSNISNSNIDNIINIGIKYGSYGAKLLGAGGGGFLTLIAEPCEHSELSNELEKLGLKKCKFGLDSSGTTVYEIN